MFFPNFKKHPALRDMFSRWNPRRQDEKEKYLETFSIKNGKDSVWKKKEYSFSNCQGCYHRYAEIQALLPVKSNQFLGIAEENPFFIAGKESKARPGKAGEVKDIARTLFNKLDAIFRKYSVHPLERF